MMDTLTSIYSQVDEEIQDARDYAADAMRCKSSHPELAQIYIKLSGEEIQHAQILQGAAAHQVATQDQAHPLSNDGKTLTDWIKSCQDERIGDVKRMHEAYQAAK